MAKIVRDSFTTTEGRDAQIRQFAQNNNLNFSEAMNMMIQRGLLVEEVIDLGGRVIGIEPGGTEHDVSIMPRTYDQSAEQMRNAIDEIKRRRAEG